jgi:hypothetical protein
MAGCKTCGKDLVKAVRLDFPTGMLEQPRAQLSPPRRAIAPEQLARGRVLDDNVLV